MNTAVYWLLAASVIVSSVRNIFSKNLIDVGNNMKYFFSLQKWLFLFAAVITGIISRFWLSQIALRDICIGGIYGLFLFFSQSFLTLAMKNISLSICSTVYAFGFIIPTVASVFLYNEELTVFKAISIVLCLLAVYIMFYQRGRKFTLSIYLIIAALASGGLGVVQKIQQSTVGSRENLTFLPIAFLAAAVISLSVSLVCKGEKNGKLSLSKKQFICAVVVGVCFGIANAVNTKIAGKLPGMIAFPLTNLSVIFFSTLASVVIFRERIKFNQIIALIIGAAGIILLNI